MLRILIREWLGIEELDRWVVNAILKQLNVTDSLEFRIEKLEARIEALENPNR